MEIGKRIIKFMREQGFQSDNDGGSLIEIRPQTSIRVTLQDLTTINVICDGYTLLNGILYLFLQNIITYDIDVSQIKYLTVKNCSEETYAIKCQEIIEDHWQWV